MKNLTRLFLLIVLAVIAGKVLVSDFDLSKKDHANATASVVSE
ncbi:MULTISPECIES: hypothetical protein [Bizionia]|uniref:Uncharacterized protein n=1 Tax=Bizionia hallyeonensis TaxID=1123757 RepID=A0ABW0C3H8_9FLAO|nr:hypothetical protein [Bizionia sp. M204]